MLRFLTEASTIYFFRTTLGDKKTAELLFSQDYDPGFVSRHPNQLAALYMALAEE